MKNCLSINKYVMIALFMGLFFPMVAFAQNVAPTSAPFQLAPNDYFVDVILKGFLGPIIDRDGVNAQTTISGAGNLGEIFKTFNLGVAFFGTLMVTFITIVGVMQSGQDGEFLGKKWSSMWVPFRFAAGSALMLPLSNSGFSFVQAFVIWIAMQGIGFADTLWSTIVTQIMDRNVSQVWGTIDGVEVANNVMQSAVCTASVVKNGGSLGLSPEFYQYGPASPTTDADRDQKSMVYMWSWGEKPYFLPFRDVSILNSKSGNQKVCGSMLLTFTEHESDPYSEARAVIAGEHGKEIRALSEEFKSVAESYVESFNDVSPAAQANHEAARNAVVSAINSGAERYRKAVAAAANVALSANKDRVMAAGVVGGADAKVARMKEFGFVSAGMYYIDMTRVHGAVRESINAKPQYTAPSGFPREVGNYDVIAKDFAVLAARAKSIEGADTLPAVVGDINVEKPSQFAPNLNMADMETEDTDVFVEWSNKISAGMIRLMFGVGASNTGTGGGSWELYRHVTNGHGASNNTSTVLQLKNKGDMILDAAGLTYLGAVISGGTLGGTADAANSNPVTGPMAVLLSIGSRVYEYAFPMMLGAIFAMVAFGFSLSIYVPMVPYIMWMGGVIGYLVLIAEALVAASLWAVMLMHPSGEGMTSQQSSRGVMLLLSLFTRPALMLMGMVVGMFMLEPLVMMINDTFYYAMKSVQGATVSMLFSTFGFCAIYVSLILTVVNKCFSMIHILPDKVLRWIGGGEEPLGEGSVRDHAKTTVTALAHGVGNIKPPPKKAPAGKSGGGNPSEKA